MLTAAGEGDFDPLTKPVCTFQDLRELLRKHDEVQLPRTFYNLLCGLAKFPYTTVQFRQTCITKMREFWEEYPEIREYPNMKQIYKQVFQQLLHSYETLLPLLDSERKSQRYMKRFLRSRD